MNLKYCLLLAATFLSQYNLIYTGSNGGAIAAGVLGGFGAGAILGAASSSNRRSVDREVVYVQDYQPTYKRRKSKLELSRWEQDLINLENELTDKQDELNQFQLSLNKKAKSLSMKEKELITREKNLESNKNKMSEKNINK